MCVYVQRRENMYSIFSWYSKKEDFTISVSLSYVHDSQTIDSTRKHIYSGLSRRFEAWASELLFSITIVSSETHCFPGATYIVLFVSGSTFQLH